MTEMSHRPASPLLVLISAPSGGGKTTVCQQLLARHPELTRVVTCTTRPPRPGERSGIDYHFLDPAAFERRVEAGEFLEHAQVYAHRYGTLRAAVLDRLRQGRDILLSLDVQGVATILKKAAVDPELARALVTVFLTPLTLAELEARLRKRGTEDELVMQHRLSEARRELACWHAFDYLVISGSMAEDLRRLEVILEAERMRQDRIHAPAWEPETKEAEQPA
jgi:guanylate kinase